MATTKILARSWDIQVSGGSAIYVPTACSASTTSSSTLTAGVDSVLTVASGSGIAAGQGLVIDSGGAHPESVRVQSISGTTVTLTAPVQFSHSGTYNVVGAPCAIIYTAPAEPAPTAGAIQTVASRLQAYFTTNASSLTLYVIPSGLLASDAGVSMIQFFYVATAGNQYVPSAPVVFLNPGDQLAWVASASGISCQIDGAEGVGAASTTTQTST